MNKVFVLPSQNSNEGDSLTQNGRPGRTPQELYGEDEKGKDSAFGENARPISVKGSPAVYRISILSLLEGNHFSGRGSFMERCQMLLKLSSCRYIAFLSFLLYGDEPDSLVTED